VSVDQKILKVLESESIEILRETAAVFRKPVMMYSIGKDSSVLLHLAKKAFYPAPIPFPLLHIDTTWKFKEMISFRDEVVAEAGVKLLVHTNQEGVTQVTVTLAELVPSLAANDVGALSARYPELETLAALSATPAAPVAFTE